MEIKAVKKTRQPEYPTLEYYILNPELLAKNIPESWLRNKYVAASLATFVLLGSPKAKMLAHPAQTEIIDKNSVDPKKQSEKEAQDSVRVAPVFTHGEGSGATGCVVISPPVFISEDEARQIIFNALEAEGISLDTLNCPVLKFSAIPIANDCYIAKDDTSKIPDADIELTMDGYNKELNLAIQYVSSADFYRFRSDDGCWSSVQSYDTKQAAEIIRQELKKNGTTNAVVFYDPMASIDFNRNGNWRKISDEAKEEAKKLLLAQVADFIKWIKKEDIIKK